MSRYAQGTDSLAREMAVTVADEWQHKGLGRLLALHLIDCARSHEVRMLYSIEFADNTAMRHLAEDLGMSVRRSDEDNHQVIYSLSL